MMKRSAFPMSSHRSDDIVATSKEWMAETALPFWAKAGVDPVSGGFHERLNWDGSADLRVNKRLRVQARQIYVYAHAAHLGWYPEGTEIALRGFDYMMSKAHAPDGTPGFVHLLTPQGGVASPLRDSYDHAFVLLATAWLAKVSGDAQVRAVVDQTLDFIDEYLTAEDGSLLEGYPASLPRRQNPHMHGFEAMLALHETLGHPQALTRARRYLGLMEQRFLDPETRTLGEFFADDWSRSPAMNSDSIEPGHQAEWCWLLRRYEQLAGLNAGTLASELLDKAVRLAEPHTGLLIDEADRFMKIRCATKRTWPQTELAKAWIAEAEAGRPGADAKARAALENLFTYYIDRPLPGTWVDQLDAQGRVAVNNVPASTLYHIFVAIAEADRVLGHAQPVSIRRAA